MKSQRAENKRGAAGFAGKKIETVLLRASSEAIRVYLWFLQFSNYLLRLVQ